MKKITTLVLLSLLVAGISNSYGQDLQKFVGKRKDAAKSSALNRTGREADKEVDKQVNKALDKIFGSENEQKAKSDSTSAAPAASSESHSSGSSGSSGSTVRSNALMSAMGLTTSNANIKPMYEFEGFIEMTLTEYEKGNKEEDVTVYKTHFDPDSYDYCMEFREPEGNEKSLIIFDTKNGLMLTLSDSDGEKTGFAMNFTPEQADSIAESISEEEQADAYSAYKTGKTKKILGYSCDEYVIEDDYGITTMWVTKELEKEMKKSYMQNSTFSGLFVYAYNTNGVVMENIYEDKENDKKTVMTVTDIDLNKSSSFSTMGYTIISTGVMPAGQ